MHSNLPKEPHSSYYGALAGFCVHTYVQKGRMDGRNSQRLVQKL